MTIGEEEAIESAIASTTADGTESNGVNVFQNAANEIAQTGASRNFTAEILHDLPIDAPAVAPTSNSTSGVVGSHIDATDIKEEIKTESRNRLLEANKRNPIVDLTNDPDEVEALAAVENNLNLDDSDDDIQELSSFVTAEDCVPSKIKFEIVGNDIISGDIPFIIIQM